MSQDERIPKKHWQSSFGGKLLSSNPKEARPFSSKLAMHVVLKSSLAKGGFSFFKNQKKIKEILEQQKKLHRVHIYTWQIVGNYVHIVIKTKTRKQYHSFIRSITGIIPRRLLGVERGRAKKKQFWDYRPFSRLVQIKSFYKTLKNSFYEALGYNKEQASYLLMMDSFWKGLRPKLE